MFWLMSLLMFGQDPAPTRPEPIWRLPSTMEIMRCGRRLREETPAYEVTLTCNVNDHGRPSDCEAQAGHTANPRELDVARCIARNYRLTNLEARDPQGRVVLRIMAFPA